MYVVTKEMRRWHLRWPSLPPVYEYVCECAQSVKLLSGPEASRDSFQAFSANKTEPDCHLLTSSVAQKVFQDTDFDCRPVFSKRFRVQEKGGTVGKTPLTAGGEGRPCGDVRTSKRELFTR